MKTLWSSTPSHLPVQHKFKHLKQNLIFWNKFQFGNIEHNLKIMERRMELLEDIAEFRNLSMFKQEEYSSLSS